MSSPTDSPEIRARLARLEQYRRQARSKTTAQLTIEWADATLKAPLRVPQLNGLIQEHVERMAEARRDPKSASSADEGRARQRRFQYERWLGDVSHEVWTHGIRLLQELERDAPGDVARLNAVSARVATLLSSLRDLKLAWWPIHWIDEDHREYSLLEHCELLLGQLETQQIRRAGGRGALPSGSTSSSGAERKSPRPSRADVDDRDDWRPQEPLL